MLFVCFLLAIFSLPCKVSYTDVRCLAIMGGAFCHFSGARLEGTTMHYHAMHHVPGSVGFYGAAVLLAFSSTMLLVFLLAIIMLPCKVGCTDTRCLACMALLNLTIACGHGCLLALMWQWDIKGIASRRSVLTRLVYQSSRLIELIESIHFFAKID